jgi:hypothetical protein
MTPFIESFQRFKSQYLIREVVDLEKKNWQASFSLAPSLLDEKKKILKLLTSASERPFVNLV